MRNYYQTKALSEQTGWNCWVMRPITSVPTFESWCRFALAVQLLEQLPGVFTKRHYERMRDDLGGFAPTLEWVRDKGLIECIYSETFTIEKEGQTIEAKRNYYVISESFKQDVSSNVWQVDKHQLRSMVNKELQSAQKKVTKMKATLEALE